MTTLKDKVAEKLFRFFSSGPTSPATDPHSINFLKGSADIRRMEGSGLKSTSTLRQDPRINFFPVSEIAAARLLSDPMDKDIPMDDKIGNFSVIMSESDLGSLNSEQNVVPSIIDDLMSDPSREIPLPDKPIYFDVELQNSSLNNDEESENIIWSPVPAPITSDFNLSGPDDEILACRKEISFCAEFQNLSVSCAESDVGGSWKNGYNVNVEAAVMNDGESEKKILEYVESEEKCQNLDVIGYMKVKGVSEGNDGVSSNTLHNLGVDATDKNHDECEVIHQQNDENEYNLHNMLFEGYRKDVNASVENNSGNSKIIQNLDVEVIVKDKVKGKENYQNHIESEEKCQNLDVTVNIVQNLGVDAIVKNVDESEVTYQQNECHNHVFKGDGKDVNRSEENNGESSKIIQNFDVEENVQSEVKIEENYQKTLRKMNCQNLDVTGNRKEDGSEDNGCEIAKIMQNLDVEASVKSDYGTEGTYPKWEGGWECDTPNEFNSQNLDVMGNWNEIGSVVNAQNRVVNEYDREIPKTETCTFYLRYGTCRFGLNCKFSHGGWGSINTLNEFNFKNYDIIENENEVQTVVDDQNLVVNENDRELPKTRVCTYFLRFGSCKFGLNCKFSHPERGIFQVVEEKMGDNSNKPPYSSEQTECKFFMKTGSCKFGSGCRFIHSTGNSAPEAVLDLNFLGLPIRPGARDCSHYMRTGSCKYESNCMFNHPDPTAGGGFEPTGTDTLKSDYVLTETSPFETMFSSTPFSHERNGYEGSGAYTRAESAYIPQSNFMNSCRAENTVIPQQAKILEEFPERPGQPECSYFLKTGDCKYKYACKFHHPKNRFPNFPQCSFSDQGLPIRPGQGTCTFYERFGICKFGPSCKFNHMPNAGRPTQHSSSSLKL